MCFTVQLSKIIFRIAVCLKQLCYYIMLFSACQEVFSTFLKLFLFLSCSNSDILSHPTGCCQELFSFLFDSFVISVRSLRRNSDRIPPLAGFVNKFFEFFFLSENSNNLINARNNLYLTVPGILFFTYSASSFFSSFATSAIPSSSSCFS